ncbi:hypothetical protein LLB_2247 [Legionella longbeachae D-4968]|nr:hypothetical protein LLB_2247 [Legionella longbeachae D-4968]
MTSKKNINLNKKRFDCVDYSTFFKKIHLSLGGQKRKIIAI